MDIYSETLVKRKLTKKVKQSVLLIFITLILSSILFILVIPALALLSGLAYVSTASLIIFAIMVFFIFKKIKSYQLEFEYIITNSTLDFDKIIAQKKRERMISLEINTIEDIGLYNPAAFRNRQFDYRVEAEKNVEADFNFFIVVYHPTYKKTLITFTPDENMLEALKASLPRQLHKNISSK